MSQRHREEQDEVRNNGRKPRRNKGSALTGGMEILQTIVVKQEVQVPRTLVEVAQDMQSYTTFATFAFSGQGSTLFLGDAGMIFDHNGDRLMVVESEDSRLVGVFIWFSELRQLAEQGATKYHPRADTQWSEELENKRAYIITSLLEAISAEGGHEGVMNSIGALGEAGRIRGNISGSQDLLMMFDQERASTFYVEIAGRPLEFRSGYLSVPSWTKGRKVMKEIFGLKLRSAPLGTPNDAYKVDGYIVLEHLFSTTPPTESIGAMMADILSLFEAAGQLDAAKEAVIAIGGVIPVDDDHSDDAPGVAAEAANERAMRAAVHGPSPVAKCAPADLVAHAAMVEGEAKTNGKAIIH